MLKQAYWMAVVAAFGLVGPVNAQEPARQAQLQPAAKPMPQVQSGPTTIDFRANFDLAARTLRPSPLAPGSAEVP
ncbi:MAG: hypothetical protein IT539_07990 [Bradyrhizobiaceae bacterium]|nr:hypothetical protein [Bradyrhizobiaceae bacterium]